MPEVKGKHFAYTKKGKAAAKVYKKLKADDPKKREKAIQAGLKAWKVRKSPSKAMRAARGVTSAAQEN